MNPKPISETEAIRSDIEMTRRRMDDTMDALSERMKGRHLLDEAIGFFRSNSDKAAETKAKVREKLSHTAGAISDSASSAANAVVDTVKKNPLPILLITAGAAWLAYNATRKRGFEVEDDLDESGRYDPDTHYDRPLSYPESGTTGFTQDEFAEEGTSKFGEMKENVKDKAAAAKDQIKEKLSNLGERTRDTYESAKERASQLGSKVKERASEIGSRVGASTRQAYDKSRERVVQTADQHPIEVGLGCLAIGVLVGLALPTPAPVHRIAGPTVDRLRNRTKDAGRDIVQKGKRVVQAATSAAKQEAEAQGISVERMRASGAAIANRAEDAASDAMSEAADEFQTGMNKNRQADPADPSAARPAM